MGLSTIKCLAVYDEHRRFAPGFSCDMGPTLDADTIIVAIGQRADLTGFEELEQTPWNTIKAEKNTLQTNLPGVFAGGDIVRGPASVIEAIADGNRAAAAIDKYLGGESQPEEVKNLLTEYNRLLVRKAELQQERGALTGRLDSGEISPDDFRKELMDIIQEAATVSDKIRETGVKLTSLGHRGLRF